LYVGEEAHVELFDEVYEACMKIVKTFDRQTLESIELLVTIKILYRLGYWEDFKESYTAHTSPFTREVLGRVHQKKNELKERIKQSLRESHL
jgi:hypothetical protein